MCYNISLYILYIGYSCVFIMSLVELLKAMATVKCECVVIIVIYYSSNLIYSESIKKIEYITDNFTTARESANLQ